ncbi:Ig-like domain-containing protein, partial [Brevibacillus agri]|uniref:Ig-like domain-containing protein n=1 Tax=Brevibacillus agri TaxID=51101 RepID=UPI00289B7EF6
MISVSYKGGEEVAAEAFKVEAKAPTDTTPPTLTVDESAVTVNNATYTLTGTAEVGATVTVNGEAVTVAEDGTFSAVVTLVEGANTLTVVAKDAAGNEA